MERSFFLIKRIQKTDLYVVFSDMICRYLNLNPPIYRGKILFLFSVIFRYSDSYRNNENQRSINTFKWYII